MPTARRLARSTSEKTDNAVSDWTVLTGRDAKWHRRLARLKDLATSLSRVEHWLSRFYASPSRLRPIIENSNLPVAVNERKCLDRAKVGRFILLLKKVATRTMQLTDRRYRQFYLQRTVVDSDKRTRRADTLGTLLGSIYVFLIHSLSITGASLGSSTTTSPCMGVQCSGMLSSVGRQRPRRSWTISRSMASRFRLSSFASPTRNVRLIYGRIHVSQSPLSGRNQIMPDREEIKPKLAL